MKLCNETITVFNKRWDIESGLEVYVPTVIAGVSWYSQIVSTVDDKGLHAADRFTIRIPTDADCSGKSYVDPASYEAGYRDTYRVLLDATNEPIMSDSGDYIAYYTYNDKFTLKNGDIIVKAAVNEQLSPAELHERYTECFTVLGVTDNRRAPNAPHFRVVGS